MASTTLGTSSIALLPSRYFSSSSKPSVHTLSLTSGTFLCKTLFFSLFFAFNIVVGGCAADPFHISYFTLPNL